MRDHVRIQLHSIKLRSISVGLLLLLLAFLAGCGGATTNSSASNTAYSQQKSADVNTNSQGTSNNNKSSAPTNYTPQYLIKQLTVTMEAKDTIRVANDLQSWIRTTDTHATSSGMQYLLSGNTYSITMTFSVQTSTYNAIQRYLIDYPGKHDGRLINLNETVKDATNDYIDTQSRLKNLRTEQQRLQDLMKNAQSMSDVLSIESKLSEVEGEIEQAEESLTALNSQTTFYPITITIQPPSDGSATPTVSGSDWNAGQIAHDAFQASLHFFQFLVSVLIWLLAFSVYIIPAAILIWLITRWRKRHQPTPYPVRHSLSYQPSTPHTTPVPAPIAVETANEEAEPSEPAIDQEELPIDRQDITHEVEELPTSSSEQLVPTSTHRA